MIVDIRFLGESDVDGNRGVEKSFHFVHTEVLVETQIENLDEKTILSLQYRLFTNNTLN